MPEVLEAHREYKQADADALLYRFRYRARLGRTIVRQVAKGSSLESIAGELHKTAEQVRRYRQAYREWLRDHTEAELDAGSPLSR
jgi:hypothetical protein